MTFKKPKLKLIIPLFVGVLAVSAAIFLIFKETKTVEAACAGTICTPGAVITYDQISFDTKASYSYTKADGTTAAGVGNVVRIGEDMKGSVKVTITGTLTGPPTIIAGNKDNYNSLHFPGLNATADVPIWGFGTETVKDDTACTVSKAVGGTIFNIGGQQIKTCNYIEFKETIYKSLNTSFIQFKAGATGSQPASDDPTGLLRGGFADTYDLTWANLQSKYGIKGTGTAAASNCFNIKSAVETQSPPGAIWDTLKYVSGSGVFWVYKNNIFCFEVYKTQKEADAVTTALPTVGDSGTGTEDTTSPNGGTNSLAEVINFSLTWIVLAMTRIVYWLFASVLAPLIEALLNIHPYQDTFVEAIYQGWQLIRNLCNIFFIIVLLVIGLGTLFQVESYNYKHLLVKVVIAALAVNFSLVAGQAILGVADTVQQQFMPDSGNVIRALGLQLMVRPINLLTEETNLTGGTASTSGASFANVTRPIFAFALALGAFFTFLAICAFLVIRIVALWILLLISPIAYVANILPNTAGYGKQWWQKFLQYAFMTPVLAFFLNLAAVFVSSQILNQSNISQLLTLNKNSGDISQLVYIAGSQILTILFLLAGLKAASSSGVYAAAGITGLAEKATFAPFKAIQKGAGAGAERGFEAIQNKAGITLDPRIYAKEYAKYADEKKHNRLEERADKRFLGISKMPPTGSARDMLETYANWRGFKRSVKAGVSGGTLGYGNTQNKLDATKKNLAVAQEKGHLRTDADLRTQEADLTAKKTAQDTVVANYIRLSDRKKQDIENLKNLYSNSTDETTRANLASQITQQEKELNEDLHGANSPLLKAKAEQEKIDQQLQDLLQDKEVQADIRLKYNIHDDASIAEEGEKARNSITGFQSDLKKYTDRSAQMKRPEAYSAIGARHHLVSDEMKKISGIEDSEILIELYKDAVAQGERFKGEAIVKQLAKDGNFNDLMTEMYGGSSFENAIQFFNKDFKEKFGLSDHATAEVASEVGYINEGNRIWNMSRLTEVHNGHLKLIDPNKKSSRDNHDDAIRIQMEKVEAQAQAREFTRFAYVDEEKGADGAMKYSLHEPGKAIIRGLNNPGGLKQINDRMKANVKGILVKAFKDPENAAFLAELDGTTGDFSKALAGEYKGK